MANENGNILLQNTMGRIGKELVIKQYAYGISTCLKEEKRRASSLRL